MMALATDSLRQDIRFALRTFATRTNRTAIVTAVITLGIAIASCAVIVSLLDGALFRPLGYGEDEGRLVNAGLVAQRAGSAGGDAIASVALFEAWRSDATVFSGIAAYQSGTATLTGNGRPRRIPIVATSSEMMSLLRARPLIGRTFVSEDDLPGSAPVVIVSSAFWRAQLGAEPGVTQRTLTLNGETYRIVGVMPPSFRIPASVFGRSAGEVWVPLSAYAKVFHVSEDVPRAVSILAKLKPSVIASDAEAQLDRIAADIGANRSAAGAERFSKVISLRAFLTQESRRTLLLLFGAVCFIVLIACANVANLLLSRAVSRSREIATRVALGASRRRIVTQLATECLLLGLVGATLGVALAALGLPFVSRLAGAGPLGDVTMSWRVLLGILAVTLVAVVVFAPGQILLTLRVLPASVLRDGVQRGGARRNRLTDVLVAFQLALTLILLLGAALLTQSFRRSIGPDRGYDVKHMAFALVALTTANYDTPDEQLNFSRRILDAARSVPGASNAAVATGMPILSGPRSAVDTGMGQRPGEQRRMNVWSVTPSFYRTLGLPLRRGVLPTPGTESGVVIDEAATRLLFPGANPIGRTIQWDGGRKSAPVVAVVGDIEEVNYVEGSTLKARTADPHIYAPLTEGSPVQILVVRSESDPARLLASIDSAFARVAPDVPLEFVSTGESLLASRSQSDYVFAVVLTLFSGVAIVMAGAGIYGTVAYATARRSREMAIRLALGAPASSIMAVLMRRELALALIGIIVGVVASLPLMGLVRNRLFEVPVVNPPLIAGVAGLLFVVSAAAVFVPSRRVTRVDPNTVLREE